MHTSKKLSASISTNRYSFCSKYTQCSSICKIYEERIYTGCEERDILSSSPHILQQKKLTCK